ncbi:MAG: hypothetical protein IPL79_18185 [Myxococcales bacterium]|nr:hypothetical protein [Myxococcales bacterium]
MKKTVTKKLRLKTLQLAKLADVTGAGITTGPNACTITTIPSIKGDCPDSVNICPVSMCPDDDCYKGDEPT